MTELHMCMLFLKGSTFNSVKVHNFVDLFFPLFVVVESFLCSNNWKVIGIYSYYSENHKLWSPKS